MATTNKIMKTFNVPSGSDTICYEIFDDKGRKCIAKDWYANSTAKFNAGEYVIKDGVCYRFTTTHAANTSWSSSEVAATNLGAELSDVKSALDSTEEDVAQLQIDVSEKVDKYQAEETYSSLPVETSKPKKIVLSEKGKVYNSNGNLYDICGLENGTYVTDYGITLTVTNKSHIALSGTSTAAHYIKITDGVQAGLYRNTCGATTKNFDYPVGSDWEILIVPNIDMSGLGSVVVVNNDGTQAASGGLNSTNGIRLQNYDNWAGIALYIGNGKTVPTGFAIDIALNLYGEAYVIPSTEIMTLTEGFVTGNGLIASNKSGACYDATEFDPFDLLEQVEAITEEISHTGTIEGDGDNIIITLPNVKYTVSHIENQTINADLWRIYKAQIKTPTGWEILWDGEDADGVVKLSGEDDFIGGFHGDEILTTGGFQVFVDGVELNSFTFAEQYFEEVVMYHESDVYHCNTSSTPSIVAFRRYKILQFNKDGCVIKNHWTAQDNLQVLNAFFGMLTVRKMQSNGTDVLNNGYYTNIDYKKLGNTTATAKNPLLTEVVFNTAFGDVKMRMTNVTTETGYKGSVDYYSTGNIRLKAYMGPISAFSVSPVSIVSGAVLKGETEIKIN